MPLTKPLPDLRRDLQDILQEDLAAALNALKELLPEGADKHSQVLAMRARLNDANKEHAIRHTISSEEYQLRVNTIRAGCIDLIRDLEEADFEAQEPVAAATDTAEKTAKQGSVLYRVPRQMPLQKPSICTIRVAIDEDALVEDIMIDDQVRFRQRVEISDMMSAELLDPAGEVFTITALSEPEQLVRDKGYTQWLFSVTPRVEGEHQLLIKVAMMEYVPNLDRYVPREVSILETVTIVTEAAAATDSDDAPLKPAGYQFAVGQDASVRAAGSEPPVSPPAAGSPPKSPSAGRPLRTAVLFMAFAVLGVGATLALNSSPPRDWWLVLFQNDAEAYAEYIEKYQNTDAPQLEKAYCRKADITGALSDLRDYQRKYPQGECIEPVLEKIKALETQAIASIRQQPDPEKIRQFALDFPESEFLAEIGATGQGVIGVENSSQTPGDNTVPATPSEQPSGAPNEPSKTPKEQPQTTHSKSVVLNRRSGLNMTFVQGGAFTMGDNSDKAACTHSVIVKNFEIGQYEVTQADWREVMGGFPMALGFPGCDDCPVERVSWDDVQEFIKTASAKYGVKYRLPAEEEWEFAARGGKKSKGYKYSGSNNLGDVAWYRNNSDSKTHPVGGKKANELGLCDMSGNVFEWCQDKYGPYPNCAEPPQITSQRVYRGGNWEFYDAFNPVSFRDSKASNSRSSGVGFRLAR